MIIDKKEIELKERMDQLRIEHEKAKNEYYTYLYNREKNCKHEWKEWGFNYRCNLCGKIDYY